MPEDTKDKASEVADAGLPKPTFADASQASGSELSAEAIAQQFEQRLKDTEERLSRKFQSQKDKELADIRRTYGDLSEVQKALAEVKAGGDPDAVFAAIEQRNLYAKVAELEQKLTAPTPVSQGKSEQDEAFTKAVGLLQDAGLANDPDVQKVMGGTYKNPTDFLFEVNKLVLTRNTKTQPAAASATSPAGGGKANVGAAAIQAQIDAILGNSQKAISAEGRAELKTLAKQLEALEAQ